MSNPTTSHPCVGCEVRNKALVGEGYQPNTDTVVRFEDSSTPEIAITNTCLSKLGATSLVGEARLQACGERLAWLEQRLARVNVTASELSMGLILRNE